MDRQRGIVGYQAFLGGNYVAQAIANGWPATTPPGYRASQASSSTTRGFYNDHDADYACNDLCVFIECLSRPSLFSLSPAYLRMHHPRS
jgi:hypothetical protein